MSTNINRNITKKDLISVIVPAYNVENYIENCLKSICNQYYPFIEIIVVNDGSKDNTLQIIQQMSEQDYRIRYYTKKNGGLSDARNFGLTKANGKYITFVDSDDLISPDFLSVLYHEILKNNADIASCEFLQFDHIDANKLTANDLDYKITVLNNIDAMKFWYISDFSCPTVATNKLYKAELFSDVKFNVGKLHEDEFIIHNLFLKAKKVVYVWKKLYFYYINPNSITSVHKYNIKRLHSVEALEERLNIFKLLNDSELYRLCLSHYVDVLLGCSVELCLFYDDEDKEFYVKNLKNKILNNYKKSLLKTRIKSILYLRFPYLYLNIYKRVKNSK